MAPDPNTPTASWAAKTASAGWCTVSTPDGHPARGLGRPPDAPEDLSGSEESSSNIFPAGWAARRSTSRSSATAPRAATCPSASPAPSATSGCACAGLRRMPRRRPCLTPPAGAPSKARRPHAQPRAIRSDTSPRNRPPRPMKFLFDLFPIICFLPPTKFAGIFRCDRRRHRGHRRADRLGVVPPSQGRHHAVGQPGDCHDLQWRRAVLHNPTFIRWKPRCSTGSSRGAAGVGLRAAQNLIPPCWKRR